MTAVAAAVAQQAVPVPVTPASSAPASNALSTSLPSQTATVTPPPFRFTIDGLLSATNNSGLTSVDPRSDLVADLKPSLLLDVRGPRLTLSGAAGVDLIAYANHTQPDRALPDGHVDLNLTLLDRNLFFDGSVDAERSKADAFAAQGQGASTANTLSTLTYRASPYFQHEFSPELSVLARSDTIVSHSFGSTENDADTDVSGNSQLQREIIRIDRKPTPFGLIAEASREDTSYSDQNGTTLRVDSAKVTGDAALGSDWIAGVVAGYDKADYSLGDVSHSLYGLMTQWRPNSRTLLDAEVERRFFGTGWKLDFRHRWPLTLVDVQLERSPSATPASNVADSAADLARLLGPALSSTDGSAAARSLLASHGQASDFSKPLLIFSDSAQVFQKASVSATTTGVRTSLAGTAFYVKATTINTDGSVPAIQPFDSLQKGGTLALNRKLDAVTTGTAQVTWTDLHGLAAHVGDSAKQTTAVLSLTRSLSPLASLTAGIQRLVSRVVSGSVPDSVNESQAFIGLRMRY